MPIVIQRCPCGRQVAIGVDDMDPIPVRVTCHYHRAIATLVELAAGVGSLEGLEAVADLLRMGAAVRREHQRELSEEVREGQRAARDSYHEGRADEAAGREGYDG